MGKPDRITPKEQRFIDEYLIDLNATQAYRRAGYKAKNDNVAGVMGNRLLGKTKIRAAIDARNQSDSERLGITRDRVLSELAKIAFSDITEYLSFGASGVKLKDSVGLAKDKTAVIAEVSETITAKASTLKFKLYDKPTSLTALGNHLGLFKQDINVNLNGAMKFVEDIPA